MLTTVTLSILLFYPSTRRRLFQQYRRGDSWAIGVGVYIFGCAALFVLLCWDTRSRVGNACLLKCKGQLCQLCSHACRGSNYTLDDESEDLYQCLVTGYSFLHVVLYFFLGLLTPYLLPYVLLVGVGWELFEKRMECHDQMDVAYNTIGFILGGALRFCLDKPVREITNQT